MLDQNPQSIRDALTTRIAATTALAKGLEKVRASAWEEHRAKVTAALQDLEAASSDATTMMQCISFLLGKTKKAEKAVKQSVRHKRTKVQTKLEEGGWCTQAAKKISLELETPPAYNDIVRDPMVKNFDLDRITVWDASNEYGANLCKGFLATVQGQLDMKIANLASYLSDVAKSGGAMAKVDAMMPAYKDMRLFGDMAYLEERGAQPWVCAARLWAFRHGPAAWPLTGFGSFVTCVSDAASAYLVILPVDGALARGIPLCDLSAFLDTKTGQGYMDEHLRLVSVPAGRTIWVPYGNIVLPLAVDPSDEAKKTTDAATDQETSKSDSTSKDVGTDASKETQVAVTKPVADAADLATFLVFTPLLVQRASSLGASWTAIASFNMDHLDRNKARSTWTSRADVIAKFCADADKP